MSHNYRASTSAFGGFVKMVDKATDFSGMINVFALISILHVFGRICNINKRVESRPAERIRSSYTPCTKIPPEKESHRVLNLCPAAAA